MRGALALALLLSEVLLTGDVAYAADRDPVVVHGQVAVDGNAQSAGTAIPPGATVTAQAVADMRMVDGTIVALKPDTAAVFTGPQNDGSYRLRIERGELSLDTSQRLPGTHAVWYRITTPLHTLVSFLSTQGTIVVNSAGDRIVCRACARGDFVVRSFDNSVSLSQPGQAALVTAEGGLQGGVMMGAPGDTTGDRWVVRSLVVSVKGSGGDHPAIAPCTGVPFTLRVAGAQSPIRVEAADATAVTISPGNTPTTFALRATGKTDVAITDVAGLTAGLRISPKDAPFCRSDVPPGPE
jgi:hypothetical protein